LRIGFLFLKFATRTRTASDRHDPRQEPYAVAPHVRICGGGLGDWHFYSDCVKVKEPGSAPGNAMYGRD